MAISHGYRTLTILLTSSGSLGNVTVPLKCDVESQTGHHMGLTFGLSMWLRAGALAAFKPGLDSHSSLPLSAEYTYTGAKSSLSLFPCL